VSVPTVPHPHPLELPLDPESALPAASPVASISASMLASTIPPDPLPELLPELLPLELPLPLPLPPPLLLALPLLLPLPELPPELLPLLLPELLPLLLPELLPELLPLLLPELLPPAFISVALGVPSPVGPSHPVPAVHWLLPHVPFFPVVMSLKNAGWVYRYPKSAATCGTSPVIVRIAANIGDAALVPSTPPQPPDDES
jgi:hypothetical protein